MKLTQHREVGHGQTDGDEVDELHCCCKDVVDD